MGGEESGWMGKERLGVRAELACWRCTDWAGWIWCIVGASGWHAGRWVLDAAGRSALHRHARSGRTPFALRVLVVVARVSCKCPPGPRETSKPAGQGGGLAGYMGGTYRDPDAAGQPDTSWRCAPGRAHLRGRTAAAPLA